MARRGSRDPTWPTRWSRPRPTTSSATVAERLKAKSHYYESRASSRGWPAAASATRTGKRHFVVCSGGGPSIMEAANRGAADEGKESDRAQHRASARAAAEPLRHAGPELPVPLFRASQDALPAARAGGRGVPGRLRDVRRIVRAADPDPDGQGPAAADPAVRPRILGPGGEFRGACRGGRDRARTTSTSSTGARTRRKRGISSLRFYERHPDPPHIQTAPPE